MSADDNVRERVMKAFVEALEISPTIDVSVLVYQDFPEWTSIGHMTLVAALEAEFDVLLDTDDILAMSSFEKALEIMARHVPA